MGSNNRQLSKKVYRSPQLFDYGDIRVLTQGSGMGGPYIDSINKTATSDPCSIGNSNPPPSCMALP